MQRLILLLFLATATIAAKAQESWTLQQCIDYAMENNLQVKLQELNETLARYQLTGTKANMFPTLNGSASYNINWGRTNDPTTFQFVTEEIQTSTLSLSTSMTLFAGLRQLNTIKQNKLDISATHFQTEAVKNNIMLSITSAYLQILMSQENINSLKKQLEVSEAQYQQTKKLVDAGVIPAGDLLTVKAQLANDSMNLVTVENTLDMSILSLKILLQFDPAKELSVANPDIDMLQIYQPDVEGPEAVFNYAVDNQPQIKSAEFSLLSAEKGLMVAKGAHSPTISLGGNVRTNYSSYEAPPFIIKEPFFTQLDNNFTQSVGININVPIFNGLRTQLGVRQAKVQVLQRKYQFQQQSDQLKQDIYKAYTDAKAAYKRYQATNKNVEALETSFQYTKSRFDLGAVNALDYSIATSNLAIARIDMINAKYDYLFKLKVLDFYQGKPITLEQ